MAALLHTDPRPQPEAFSDLSRRVRVPSPGGGPRAEAHTRPSAGRRQGDGAGPRAGGRPRAQALPSGQAGAVRSAGLAYTPPSFVLKALVPGLPGQVLASQAPGVAGHGEGQEAAASTPAPRRSEARGWAEACGGESGKHRVREPEASVLTGKSPERDALQGQTPLPSQGSKPGEGSVVRDGQCFGAEQRCGGAQRSKGGGEGAIGLTSAQSQRGGCRGQARLAPDAPASQSLPLPPHPSPTFTSVRALTVTPSGLGGGGAIWPPADLKH